RGGFVVIPRLRRSGKRNSVGNHAFDHEQGDGSWYLLEPGGEPAVVAQPRTAKFLCAASYPIPWVFLVLANVLYVTSEPEELHGLKPALIHLFRDGEHRSCPHAQRPET